MITPRSDGSACRTGTLDKEVLHLLIELAGEFVDPQPVNDTCPGMLGANLVEDAVTSVLTTWDHLEPFLLPEDCDLPLFVPSSPASRWPSFQSRTSG